MTKQIHVGNVAIGGGARIAIQSMTNTQTQDAEATIAQIKALELAGCDIARLAVSNMDEVAACKKILASVSIPLVADIQYDYKLCIACSEIGFSKVRFNPGNIGSDENVAKLVSVCKANATPIRIGVNSGSLPPSFTSKYARVSEALAESALYHVGLLEKFGFYDIVISVKSSNVKTMIEANRYLANKTNYPLHIGVTESGAREYGLVKSSIGIGSLLCDGVGDTIRVSLTGDPLDEITAAKLILNGLNLREHCEVVSCPTCSRCKINLAEIVDKVYALTKNINKNLKIAVMGCAVNGIGEASDADFGVAGGDGKGVIFSKGKIIATVEEKDIILRLGELIAKS